MTGTQLNTLINFKCSTNDTTFTPAEKLTLVNIYKDEIATKIVERNNGMFLVPTHFDLVANQREYALPGDLMNRIQKVEIKFAATDDRQPAYQIKDYLGSEAETQITNTFTNAQGDFAYVIRRRAILILSGTIISVTNGVRIWYHSFPADLADLTGSTPLENDPTTTTFGFPKQFQELLARRVAIEWKGAQSKPVPLSPVEQSYASDLKTQLDAIAHVDNSGETIGDVPDESEFGNSGFDY